jgi:H-type small acid-soluble spore protein
VEKARAEEIINSKGVIEVFHKSSPVWLEQIDGEMANIEYLHDLSKSRVNLEELYEK